MNKRKSKIIYFLLFIICFIMTLIPISFSCINDILIGTAWSGRIHAGDGDGAEIDAIFYDNNVLHIFIKMEALGSQLGGMPLDFQTALVTGKFSITNIEDFSADLEGKLDVDYDQNMEDFSLSLHGTINNISGVANGDCKLEIKSSTMNWQTETDWYLTKM